GRPDWPLASILPCGAPTFLSVETTPRPPGRLTVPTSLAREFPLRRTSSATSNTPDMEALVRIPNLTSLAVRPAPVDGDQVVEPWYLRGACRGLDSAIFYPDSVEEFAIDHALSVCERCEVRPECLDHALSRREPTGIWGGTTERDRRRILRRRRSA
ncbi:MAG: WhiB family transcriptional regulator, partial [Acidimicrobiales bacterium]|nr:WhiB family transcriptional regulator [Acidimicrobiales bacterium]